MPTVYRVCLRVNYSEPPTYKDERRAWSFTFHVSAKSASKAIATAFDFVPSDAEPYMVTAKKLDIINAE